MPKRLKADELAVQFLEALGLSPHEAVGKQSRREALAEWLVAVGLADEAEPAKVKGGDK